ncbi:TonB family protein [Xylophilus sp. Kf1]|nr:TonB family protein [Xylophilus sp. Kf1]
MTSPSPVRRVAGACWVLSIALVASACATPPQAETAEARLVPADRLRPIGRVRAQVNLRDFQKSVAGGTTVLRLSIGADGKVDDIRIAESSGNASVDSAAARSLVGAAFVPYLDHGVSVPVTTLMPVRLPSSGCIMARPLDC